MAMSSDLILLAAALVAGLLVPFAAHSLGLSLFTSQALGVAALMLLLYPAFVRKRTARAIGGWAAAYVVAVITAYVVYRLAPW
jgi:hypothetical protein